MFSSDRHEVVGCRRSRPSNAVCVRGGCGGRLVLRHIIGNIFPFTKKCKKNRSHFDAAAALEAGRHSRLGHAMRKSLECPPWEWPVQAGRLSRPSFVGEARWRRKASASTVRRISTSSWCSVDGGTARRRAPNSRYPHSVPKPARFESDFGCVEVSCGDFENPVCSDRPIIVDESADLDGVVPNEFGETHAAVRQPCSSTKEGRRMQLCRGRNVRSRVRSVVLLL